jgi:hypothetical protein
VNALVLGAGSRPELFSTENTPQLTSVVSVDINPSHEPSVVHDLNDVPWPFADDTFHEIHAYEILEHLGTQGDAQAFFDHFYECWRILHPGGLLVGSVPRFDSQWAWGDPSHRRIIAKDSFIFLDQDEYVKQVGRTSMSDFRHIWHGDFTLETVQQSEHQVAFWLRAVKPSRRENQ